MEKFFLKICQAFNDNEAMFTDAGLPSVKTIDKYRGQPLNPEQFEIFELPAIFIGRSVRWEKKGKFYEGTMTVSFHILQDATWEISNISTNQEEGLKQISFLSVVRSILDDLQSDNTGKLIRSDEMEADADVSIYDIMSYTCPYYAPEAPGRRMVDTQGDKLNTVKSIKERF